MLDRSLQVTIQVAKRQLQLDDDDYREILRRNAKVTSSKDLDDAGARKVIEELRSKGFKDVRNGGSKRGRGRGAASQPMARLARAWWLNLFNLDELESGSELALNAFAKGITGKDDLRFCTGPELNKVIEGLKAWCNRIGLSAKGSPLDIRRNLVREQWARLHQAGWARISGDSGISGFAHATWCTPNARSVEQMEAEQLDKLAAKLGPIARGRKVGRRHSKENAQ